MKATFVELPAFARCRAEYLDDDGLRALQTALMENPEAGDVIEGTGACASCGAPIRDVAKANAVGCG